MTVEELIIYGKSKVPSTHAKMVLADLLDKNALSLLNILEKEISTEIVDIYKQKIDKLIKEEPLQYVIGNVNFYGYLFFVNEKVLIPRFETEELVENTIRMIESYLPSATTLIDLGCGSGAIGLTMKKVLPNLEVTLVDISKDALEVTKKNQENLQVEATLLESDMWEKVTNKYDVVISNPPYIKEEEEIDNMVSNHEPHLALYAGADGLDSYKKILAGIEPYLKKQFLLAFEIGYTQKEAVTQLIQTYLPTATIVAKQDLQGRDRMIFAYKNT